MQTKAPQGKPDPRPMPEQELERYGVWVKAEPQDILEDAAEADVPSYLDAPEESVTDGIMDDTIDSFDLEEIPSPDDTASDDTVSFDLEDFDADLATLDDDSSSDSTELMDDLDAFDTPDETPAAAASGQSDVQEVSSSEADDSFEITDVSLSDFDLDDDDSAGAPVSEDSVTMEEPESEPLDLDLTFDETLPAGDDGSSLDVLDDDTDTETAMLPEISVEDVSLSGDDGQFDDVSAVTHELASPDVSGSSDLLQKIALELSSIKEELVSLRSQLRDLKAAEPATLPGQVPADAMSHPPLDETESETVQQAASSKSGGFFDDEDDDTIALTGDELDNILNSADFTEEAMEGSSGEEPDFQEGEIFPDTETEDFSDGVSAPAEDLLPEDGDYTSVPQPEADAVENLAPEAADFSMLEDVSDDATGVEAFGGSESELVPVVDEAETIDFPESIQPLTAPPEDTAFLEEDAELELDGMPLEDVPLVEPDPSDLDTFIDTTGSMTQPALDDIDSLDLDLEELPADEPSAQVSVAGDGSGPDEEESSLTDIEVPGLEEPEELILDLDDDSGAVVSTVDSFAEPSIDEMEYLEVDLEPAVEELGGMDLLSEDFDAGTDSMIVEPVGTLPSEDSMFVEASDEPASGMDARIPDDFVEESLLTEDSGEFDDVELLPDAEPLSSADSLPEVVLEDEILVEEVEQLEEPSDMPVSDLSETLPVQPVNTREAETGPDVSVTANAAPAEQTVVSSQETAATKVGTQENSDVPDRLKHDVKSVLLYLDQLLASLPDEKIEEFASSEYYETYKRLFDDLGLI